MANNILILDGGMGTMLQAAGMRAGEHPEVFGYENPELIKDIHRQYIAAGSDVIYTNTFGANERKLEGLSISTEEAISSALAVAKEAVLESGRDVRIALDVGPLGELLEPLGTMSFEAAYEIYARTMRAGEASGADIIVIETFTDLYDAKAALLAAKENTSLPVWVTMSYEAGGRTFTGTRIPCMAVTMEGLGADAIGFNCSLGPAELLKMVRELREWTSLPIIVKPNAGLPDPATGEYNLDSEGFARDMREYLKLGVYAMGGCCGTSPEYIRGISTFTGEEESCEAINIKRNGVCSAVHMTELNGVRVIGERLNPTGKKRFAQALLEHNMEYICRVAIEEEESGADILDVNVGVPGADEAELMKEVVKAVQGIVSIPLQIDSSNIEAIEAGLRVYNGRAIINSVNADDDRLAALLPIAKKYGAALIGLTMSEGGIPSTAAERVEHAEHILEAAMEAGIKREDIIIDCLTLTVSAQQQQAAETLRAVWEVRNRLGLHCTLGVSNISFGLPQRSHITESFLTQAMYCGLDLPIINPNVRGMMDAIAAFKVLSGEDRDSEAYIKRFADIPAVSGAAALGLSKASSDAMTIEESILKGLRAETKRLAEELLDNMSELELINTRLIPALDTVGELYEKQIIFLPQLINSANAAQAAFDLIKDRLAQGGASIARGRIVVATVKGDIHDIGKNIVKVILENYGYRIIDLGRDVPIEKVVETVLREDIRLVGLSALMTTTLPSMKQTIEAVKAASPDCRIWVGGAVLTEEYAMEIGADYYARDARASVEIAKTVLGGEDED